MKSTIALTSVETIILTSPLRPLKLLQRALRHVHQPPPPPNVCCSRFVELMDGRLSSYTTNVLFTGLAPAVIAGMYEGNVRTACQTNVDSDSGLSLCLGTGRRITMAGSSYSNIVSCAFRPVFCVRDDEAPNIAKIKSYLLGTEGNCTDTAEADILAMDDGTIYHVGDSVPQDKVDKLCELAVEYPTALET